MKAEQLKGRGTLLSQHGWVDAPFSKAREDIFAALVHFKRHYIIIGINTPLPSLSGLMAVFAASPTWIIGLYLLRLSVGAAMLTKEASTFSVQFYPVALLS